MQRILSIALAALLLAGSALAQPPHTANGAEPAGGLETFMLETLWTVGDDDEVFFGTVTQVLVGDDGRIYLMDQQLSEVKVFSPAGELAAVLSREGTGPGETQRPNDMFFTDDGALVLLQVFPGRLVRIDRQGNPLGEFPFHAGDPASGGFSVLVQGESGGGNVVLAGISQSFAAGKLDQTYFLSGYAADGTENARYVEKSAQQDFAAMKLDEAAVDFPWVRFDVGPDGRVAVAPARDEYRFEIYAPDGTLERTFSRPLEPWRRTEKDTRRMTMMMEAQGRNYPVMPEITVEPTEPAVNRVQIMDDGTIWVITNRGLRTLPAGAIAEYDVFSPEGEFLRQVRLLAPGDPVEDLVVLVDPETAILVRGFWDTLAASLGAVDEEAAAEPMTVSYCRLVP